MAPCGYNRKCVKLKRQKRRKTGIHRACVYGAKKIVGALGSGERASTFNGPLRARHFSAIPFYCVFFYSICAHLCLCE